MREPQKRIVSRGKYIAVKTLAFGLTGISVLCGIGLAVLLSNVVLAYYNDAQLQALSHSRGCSVAQMDDSAWNAFGAAASLILLIPLLPMTYGAWRGSRKNWEAIRIMQPLPAPFPVICLLPTVLSAPLRNRFKPSSVFCSELLLRHLICRKRSCYERLHNDCVRQALLLQYPHSTVFLNSAHEGGLCNSRPGD